MTDQVYRLGCDIGGTFTDFVLLNDETGEIRINKCLTTPADPSDAVEQGIKELAPDVVATDCHACTLQIHQGTGVAVTHPILILKQAYGL